MPRSSPSRGGERAGSGRRQAAYPGSVTDRDLQAAPTAAPSVRRQAWATRIVFAANGALFAGWVARIPAVRDNLDADERGLGFALLFAAVGSLVAMPFSGRLVERVGARRVMAFCIVVCALAYPALGLAPNLVVLGAVLFFVGAGVGVWDVAMNVSGHAVEEEAGRDLMPGFHAGWSIGTVVGAATGALAAHGDLDPTAALRAGQPGAGRLGAGRRPLDARRPAGGRLVRRGRAPRARARPGR